MEAFLRASSFELQASSFLPTSPFPLNANDLEHPEFPTSKVTKLVERAVNCEVTLEIAPGTEIVGTITKSSVTLLCLAEGKTAFAIIKASNVMVAID
jgi:molybdopterin-binding protein